MRTIYFKTYIFSILLSVALSPLQADAAKKTKSSIISEGVAFYAFNSQAANTLPVYHLYHKKTGDHFYTIDENRKNSLSSSKTYRLEGIAFYAYSSEQPDTAPVYALKKNKGGFHFYTASEKKKKSLVSKKEGYKSLGVAFYAHSSQAAGTAPVTRFFNKKTGGRSLKAEAAAAETPWVDEALTLSSSSGPEITVGIWSYQRSYLKKKSFKIKANKNYRILNSDGATVSDIAADTWTSVRYKNSGKLRVLDLASPTEFDREIRFEAADGNNTDLIFEVSKPDAPFDKYRGKIKLRYSASSKKIWVVNSLPLEQYVWGMGEITGTGDEEYNKVMTTIFRSYGYWKIQYSTQYAKEGFKVNATPGNQLYYGYNWEIGHSRIKDAAQATQGITVQYQNDIALTPYSSWTDGKTRSFKEVWKSDSYPHLLSVSDPYGKRDGWNAVKLKKAGNHMVGLSAHGALNLASSYDWSWQKIIKYYYTGVSLAVPLGY